MRLIFIGDVVGRAGRDAIAEFLPQLRSAYRPDLVVVNGENAAHGFGITEEIFQGFLAAGADVVTLGNHSFDQREALVFIERYPNLLRPVNWPEGCPGRGAALIETPSGRRVLVLQAMGRVMIEPMLDDPFPAVERELSACPLGAACDAVLFDFHAEATSEKMAMGHFCDGRASLVVGTHTHVPTADHQILPGGTAYMSDAGMTGDYDSVIGMNKIEPLQRFQRKLPVERMRPAEGPATLCGVAVETDDATGLAVAIAPIRVGGRLSQSQVQFWST
jgi:metallophosphoesterase (TIGR00282 family)